MQAENIRKLNISHQFAKLRSDYCIQPCTRNFAEDVDGSSTQIAPLSKGLDENNNRKRDSEKGPENVRNISRTSCASQAASAAVRKTHSEIVAARKSYADSRVASVDI